MTRGGGGVQTPPKKDGIIYEQPLNKEMWLGYFFGGEQGNYIDSIILSRFVDIKLDGVGPVDNRPSTD